MLLAPRPDLSVVSFKLWLGCWNILVEEPTRSISFRVSVEFCIPKVCLPSMLIISLESEVTLETINSGFDRFLATTLSTTDS